MRLHRKKRDAAGRKTGKAKGAHCKAVKAGGVRSDTRSLREGVTLKAALESRTISDISETCHGHLATESGARVLRKKDGQGWVVREVDEKESISRAGSVGSV